MMDGKQRDDASSSTIPYRRFVGRCGLSLCLRDPCILTSHYWYVRTIRARRASDQRLVPTGDYQRTLDPRIQAFEWLMELSADHIDRHFTYGPSTLPFETPYVHEFRDLMHFFVTDHIHRLGRVFTPHLDGQVRIQTILESIHSNPTLSVCLLSNSQTDRLMQRRVSVADRTTHIVYGVTLRVLQDRIGSFRPADTPWLLLLVVALTGLEIYVNTSSRSLKAHRAAIKRMVAMQGGVNALGFVQSYVLNTDRFIALCLGEYPLYKTTFQVIRPARPPGRYGKAFGVLDGVIDPDVIGFSLDQCRLIDMLETAGIDLSRTAEPVPTRSMGTNVLPYFLHLRDKVSADHAELHSYYHDNQSVNIVESSLDRTISISRCVVLGGHIAFYAIGFGDYYTVIRPMLGSELQKVIERKSKLDWHNHEDILIWLLFVLATIPEWSRHQWAIEQLRLALIFKYDTSWPSPSWVDNEAIMLEDFVWSDQRYAYDYSCICAEIIALDEYQRAFTGPAMSDEQIRDGREG